MMQTSVSDVVVRVRTWLVACYVKADKAALALIIITFVYFIFAYYTNALRPYALGPTKFGWMAWSDQHDYWLEARALANIHGFGPTFVFGIGYPLLAVPFIWLGSYVDPFKFFDCIAFVFVAYATYRFAAVRVSRFVAVLSAFAVVFASPLLVYMTIPWRTTVSIAGAGLVLLFASFERFDAWQATGLGLGLGWVFAASYPDVLWLIPTAAVILLNQGTRSKKLSYYALAGAAAVVLIVMLVQWHYLGSPFTTPYASHLGPNGGPSDQSLGAFSLASIGPGMVGMYIAPQLVNEPIDPANGALLQTMFWCLLALPGVAMMRSVYKGFTRRFMTTTAIVTLIGMLFYLAFRGGGSLLDGALRHDMMFVPGLAILAAIAIERVAHRQFARL